MSGKYANLSDLSTVHVHRGRDAHEEGELANAHITGAHKLLKETNEGKNNVKDGNKEEIVEFQISFGILKGNRRREVESSSGRFLRRCEYLWTTLLFCVVLTLVFLNDMDTYGGRRGQGQENQRQREENQGQIKEVAAFPPLRVEVYYEALCPDSRYFVIKQLLPTYNKLKDIMKVSLVPYGKASTHEKDGHYTFKCQHGPVECRANMVHACVTNLIKDEATQLSIVSCMIDKNDSPMKVGQRCVEKFGEEWSGVEMCVTGEKGASIMKHMGDMTDALNPPVSFIPTITIDGSQAGQTKILQDLHKALCRRYKGPKPASC